LARYSNDRNVTGSRAHGRCLKPPWSKRASTPP
jgi:hypothetical protein